MKYNVCMGDSKKFLGVAGHKECFCLLLDSVELGSEECC